ncbi:MAG: flagellar biosynthesis repressor FlbT [Desulfobacterales bacterium]
MKKRKCKTNQIKKNKATMALKITLKPGERMIIGGTVIRNGEAKAELFIENEVPLLREKDIIGEKEADTTAKRIYFTVQLMYIDPENLVNHHHTYWKLVHAALKTAASMLNYIQPISEEILAGRYYKALKLTRKLISYEQEIINRV